MFSTNHVRMTPDTQFSYEQHGESFGVLTFASSTNTIAIFFTKENFNKLLDLAEQCEVGWSRSLPKPSDDRLFDFEEG